MGHLHPKKLICKVCIIVDFLQEVYILIYCLQLMSKNYTCKYHDIDRCSNEMYVMRSADVENMYLSHTENLLCCTYFLELAKIATYIIEVIFL